MSKKMLLNAVAAVALLVAAPMIMAGDAAAADSGKAYLWQDGSSNINSQEQTGNSNQTENRQNGNNNTLRANDDETQAPRKFRLEGVGELFRGHAQ
jgi:hypothetical protein